MGKLVSDHRKATGTPITAVGKRVGVNRDLRARRCEKKKQRMGFFISGWFTGRLQTRITAL